MDMSVGNSELHTCADMKELFQCCRRGDASRVVYLVEVKDVSVNVRDEWDSTPLYYACLCGHIDIVKYLLASGARCEANSFDGERCLYGALTDQIRKVLLEYKVVTSQTIRRDSYHEFLRRLLELGELSDVTFIVHGSKFFAHKCILAARCSYFCEKFENKWKNRSTIVISNYLVKPSAFKCLLQYLYCGRLEAHIDTVDDCIRLAVQCKLPLLKEELENMVRKVVSFECTKPGTNVQMLMLESEELLMDVQQDLGVLGLQAVPQDFRTWACASELPLMPTVPLHLVDLCFTIEEHKFWCHKVFFCSRSEYFGAMLRDHFSETEIDVECGAPMIAIKNIPVHAFAAVVYYIYTNFVQVPQEYIIDVLLAADMYLLPGLKRACGLQLIAYLNIYNVISRLRTARLFQLSFLEDQCTKFIADNIEKMIDDASLHEIILQDAQEVRGRQETDSIPVVDDIRYHISSDVNGYSEMSEASEKLKIIDKLLEDLGLDA
ncbi:BTB/POZ domain-containing protein 9 [Gryllus bimaculatus]|nr:BTB/POZ domain-containing protein 9 [Gryllus bimaculatus]